jgi:endonuclease-3
MAKEALADKRRRAAEVIRRLDAAMPEAEIELDYETPLELLVAVLLSAQTTDKRVNLVTPALFRDFKTAADYAATTPKVLEGYLRTVGLFRNKSKALVKLGRELVERHQGQVPGSRAALAELPGVGNKTAGVVSMHLGADKAFPVDTHILRLSRRLGLSRHTQPDPVEADLRRLLPDEQWFKAHQLLIWHGRRVCDARKPQCHRCVVADICPRRGVPRRRTTTVDK